MLAQLIKSNSPDLIEEIYDCAAKTENWPDALRSISIALNFDCCAISEVNAFPRTVRITHCYGIDPDFRQDLEENSLFNPVAHRRISASPHEPWSASQLFGAALLRSSPFYKKALAPREIDDVLLQILTNFNSGFSIFIAMRRKRGDGIQPADFRDVGAIASHIRRAYELSHLVGHLERQRDSLSDAFDVLSTGLILIDEDGHIAHANHAASQLLDEATAVVRSRDQISAHDTNAAKELRDAITVARRPPGDRGTGFDCLDYARGVQTSRRGWVACQRRRRNLSQAYR